MNAAQQWLYDYIIAWADHLDITPLEFWEQGFDRQDIKDVLLSESLEGGIEALEDAWDDMPKQLNDIAKEAADA